MQKVLNFLIAGFFSKKYVLKRCVNFRHFVNCDQSAKYMNFVTLLTIWLKLLEIYYFNITIDVYSTYKQAIMLYGAHMHRVALSLKKQNVLNETT